MAQYGFVPLLVACEDVLTPAAVAESAVRVLNSCLSAMPAGVYACWTSLNNLAWERDFNHNDLNDTWNNTTACYELLALKLYLEFNVAVSLPISASRNPACLSKPKPFIWVTKWVDYSNKYGFGYQLSDHSVGVLFNNGTHMSLLPDRKYVHVSYFL